MDESSLIERLLTLPAKAAEHFAAMEPSRANEYFVGADPPERQLGSGGGTAYLLARAWEADATRQPKTTHGFGFGDWLRQSRKLVVHGSGESRRLPAYAAAGKPLIPIPILRGASGQRLDQKLLDLQFGGYARIFRHAPPSYRVMVGCGDVMLQFDQYVPLYPKVDVLIVGLAASPEEAQQHGVMICPLQAPHQMAFFLQKPSAERIRELARGHVFYLDTGVWMLTERALAVLMERSGWDAARQRFQDGLPRTYDLYAAVGPALGHNPDQADPDVNRLGAAVLALPEGRFYHFGTHRSLLTSVSQLRRPAAEQRSVGHASLEHHADPIVQHADVRCPLRGEHRYIWIENASLAAGWTLSERHVLTGIPPNDWSLRLDPGACLDMVPLEQGAACVRFYGFDDAFRGALGSDTTLWMGRPAGAWFADRGIDGAAAGLDPSCDIQDAALFPVLSLDRLDGEFVAWLTASRPADDARCRSLWLSLPRLSARSLLRSTDVVLLSRQRIEHVRTGLQSLTPEGWADLCPRLDLATASELCSGSRWPTPPDLAPADRHGPVAMHDAMFRCAIALKAGTMDPERWEQEAFEHLRSLIVGRMEAQPVRPCRHLMDDQIVWGRSPVRLDLAGGWTDTPPYCLEHGGQVVNLAVNLNGQPPIQVFGRMCERPEIVLRSVDLGVDERVTEYGELEGDGRLGSAFGIARAALALAGFSPRFHAAGAFGSLREQMEKELGGGFELSMVCAVPKGSGLGTSSILAATLLGTLGNMFGMHWSPHEMFARTLAAEQMLTSGGGWQDQVGGASHGLKLIETCPGLDQRPTLRWLPSRFFGPEFANRQVLLYYTGLTRMAHDILGEIVRGLFLNSPAHLGFIRDIGQNARFAADAIQRDDWEGLCEAVRRSWLLNRRLDRGTCPPAVEAILAMVNDYLEAYKLLGAGGGGYLLMLAHDEAAARRAVETLTADPPNGRARFVDLQISETGLQVTRS